MVENIAGIKKNKYADKIIEELGFKWWASSSEMIGRRHPKNSHSYFGVNQKILDLPTNIAGSIFNRTLKDKTGGNALLRILKALFGQYKREQYLQYLYENGLIISIQEHFQNQRTDGKRQTPNIFDDLISLDRIFGILRGSDVWYATCSEIAHYLESYDNTEIIQRDDRTFEVKYNGRWGKPFLSMKSNYREIKNVKTDAILKGVYKKGEWVYNDFGGGEYQLL